MISVDLGFDKESLSFEWSILRGLLRGNNNARIKSMNVQNLISKNCAASDYADDSAIFRAENHLPDFPPNWAH